MNRNWGIQALKQWLCSTSLVSILTFLLQGMHLIYEQLAMLDDLHTRYARFMEGASALKEEMHNFKSDIAEEVAAVLARTPLTIQPRKTPTDIDSENPTCESLPPPIVPQV